MKLAQLGKFIKIIVAKMIEEIIEKTKNANKEVKKEAVLSLGKLKELTSKELGTVVIILLSLFEDETLRNDGEKRLFDMRNDSGDSLYELSKKWDLGKSIPKKLRRQVIQHITDLDAKNVFFMLNTRLLVTQLMMPMISQKLYRFYPNSGVFSPVILK